MKRILIALILFTLLAGPVLADADPEWLRAFEVEHGYMPQDDPGLLALGMTPDEALAEHVMAREWSLLLGHTPDMAEWLARWCLGHSCIQLRSEYPPASCPPPPICWFGMTGRGCRGTYTGEWPEIPCP